MLVKNFDGFYVEVDEGVCVEVVCIFFVLDCYLVIVDFVGKLFYGVLLGSVLLLVVLGLVIIFGFMGIINMVYGELLMIGVYIIYVCQLVFCKFFFGVIDVYLVVVLLVVFIVVVVVGIVLECLVICWFYGCLLEILFCIWGISLMLM